MSITMRTRRSIDVGKAVAFLLIAGTVVVGLYDFVSTLPEFEDSMLRGEPRPVAPDAPVLKIPPSLDSDTRRRLSLNLGGGACKWEPPEYEVPTDITFFKTLIAGFPSCDKRMTFTQMEALTGWPARDEWDFVFYGGTNHPFIKSNYPHHEGYWSWDTRADQVVLVVRNMRKTMVEYHDILWDIATAKNSGLSYLDVLYRYRPPIESFFEWRDYRVLDEIHWYGWFIDYWMEGVALSHFSSCSPTLTKTVPCDSPGLRRDIFNHSLTSEDHWPYAPPPAPPTPDCVNDPWHAHKTSANTCTNNGDFIPPTHSPSRSPTPYPSITPTVTNYTGAPIGPGPGPTPPIAIDEEPYLFNSLAECCAVEFPGGPCYSVDACPTPSPTPAVVASYDPHCANGEITNGCEPVAVISAEKLRDMDGGTGAAETQAIANILTERPGISEYLISNEAWDCIWTELIPNGRGMRMVRDREGYVEEDYNFSAEMLQGMVDEYDRLILKYGDAYWSSKPTAVRLRQLLMEHRASVQLELNDVNSGARRLSDRDFLGPDERERRRRLKAIEEGRDPEEGASDPATRAKEKKRHFEYFAALEEKVKSTRRAEKAKKRQEERKMARKEQRQKWR
ncbi:hypothetical protein ACHAWF_008911 [Thalassiosira exigua]